MKLSQNDKCVLVAAQLNAELSARDIAKRCSIREPTVRRILSRLQRDPIIQPAGIANIGHLGLQEYFFCFSFSHEGPQSWAPAIEMLKQSPLTTWLFELGGSLHCQLGMAVQNVNQLQDCFEAISRKLGDIICNRKFAATISYEFFGRSYLWPDASSRQSVFAYQSGPREAVDELDLKLLNLFSAHPLATMAQDARELGVAATTVQYRLAIKWCAPTLISSR